MSCIKRVANILLFRCFDNFLWSFSVLKRNCYMESFKFSDLQIEIASEAQKMPKPHPSTLTFGETFSDHMFEVNWNVDTGWDKPKIIPLKFFSFHPGSVIFHYAQAAFDGLKAFKCPDGTINVFRPDLHTERFRASAERAALPLFDSEEFLKCLMKLVRIDKGWIPSYYDSKLYSSSLYIRPTLIGTENALGINPSNTAMLYIVTCPVRSYFKISQTRPISLLADPTFVRTCYGGVGDKQVSSNYAPALYVHNLAQSQGLHEVLWLREDNHRVTEVGAMNVFFFFQKGLNDFELATPALDGTLLPGVIRQSFLDLSRQYKEFEVSERIITMDEIVKASETKTLKEVFVCGTAAGCCPVNKIRYLDKDINIPTMDSKNLLYQRLYKALCDIQYGRIESDWSIKIQ